MTILVNHNVVINNKANWKLLNIYFISITEFIIVPYLRYNYNDITKSVKVLLAKL
jgi:hypothetical protein